jgi:anti-anti-sigma regulatory factor
MLSWRRVALVGGTGRLRAAAEVAAECAAEDGAVLLTGHRFGRVVPYARLLCRHLGRHPRPWAAESDLTIGREPGLLRLAQRSGCRALVLGPEPDPLLRETLDPGAPHAAAGALRRIRRAGLLTVVHVTIGRESDDAGVFARAVWLATAGRVPFPRLAAHPGAGPMSPDELRCGLAWAERALHGHRAIWRRTGIAGPFRRAALVANYRLRRVIMREPTRAPTPAMRLARALARPIRIRERVPFVSMLVGAVQAGGVQVRSTWLRARARRDDARSAFVIRLEGAVDARAARKLVGRIRRAVGRTPERIVIDLGGLELVSLTVLTRFLEEHAGRLAELRGRLAFRNLGPALVALRRNLHGMLPNAALLEHALEETP